MLKLIRLFLKPLYSHSGRVECRIVLLKVPKSVGIPNEHEWMQKISQDAHVCVTCHSSIRRIRGPISLQLHTPHTITEPPAAWTVPCWHAESMDPRGCLHARARPSARYNWERDSSDQATGFQSSSSPMCGSSVPKAHIDDVSLNCSHADTCWWPSIEIRSNLRKGCTSVTLKNCLESSLVSFLHNPYPAAVMWEIWCFTEFPTRYTREMVVRENHQCIPTSEMLCPILRAPRSNSLESW